MKKLILVLTFSTFLLFSTSSVFALGLGFYVPFGTGDSEQTRENDYGDDIEFDVDTDYRGIGFVLDTTVARDSVFNYRLNVGYEKGEYSKGGGELDWDRLAIDHTFGFAVLRTKVVRLYLGPQLRLAFLSTDSDYNDTNAFGIGFGPVLGANFNIGNTVTLGFDTGYRFTKYFGVYERDDDSYRYYDDDEEFDYDSNEGELFVNFNVIFRINDVYRGRR